MAPLRFHWTAAFLAWCLAVAFVAFKSKALQAAVAAPGLRLGWLQACRLFCEGIVLDLLTWPGKLWCDAYRIALLPGDSTRMKVYALLRFRVGGIAGTSMILVVSFLILAHESMLPAMSWLLIGLAALPAVVAAILVVRRGRRRNQAIRSVLPVMAWSLPATLSDATAFSLIAHLLTNAPPIPLGAWYVVLCTAGAISTLPLSIGVFDVGCWLVLTRFLGAESAAVVTAIAVHRTIGPLNTVVLGAASMFVRGLNGHAHARPAWTDRARPLEPGRRWDQDPLIRTQVAG